MQMLFLLFKKEITKTFKLNYLKRGNVSQRNKIMASYIAVGVAFVFFPGSVDKTDFRVSKL